MYLHLGADCMIKNTDIIAIFNIREEQSSLYYDFMENLQRKYRVVDLTENGEYYSFILTEHSLYLSGISALTLKKRVEEDFVMDAVFKSF